MVRSTSLVDLTHVPHPGGSHSHTEVSDSERRAGRRLHMQAEGVASLQVSYPPPPSPQHRQSNSLLVHALGSGRGRLPQATAPFACTCAPALSAWRLVRPLQRSLSFCPISSSMSLYFNLTHPSLKNHTRSCSCCLDLRGERERDSFWRLLGAC